MTITGSCHCGSITYEAKAIDGGLWHCHCRTCRKTHAADRNTAARVKREDYRLTNGANKLKTYESSPGKFRHFCSTCGAHIYAERPELPFVVIRAGTLDEDPGTRPIMNVWTSHSVAWLRCKDGIANYPEAPPT